MDETLTLANLRPGDLACPVTPAAALADQTAALRDPIGALAREAARHAAITSDASLESAALAMMGIKPVNLKATVSDVPAAVPAPLRRPVGLLVSAIVATNAEVKAASARLSPAERRTLLEALPRLAAEDPTVPLDFAKEPSPEFTSVRSLLERVDVGRICAAGAALADTVRETIPALRAAGYKGPTQVLNCGGLVVELGGMGPDVHTRRDVALCIDFGGDDRYTGRYAAGAGYAAVLIDLAGNDRYFGADLSFGAGILGVGVLFDEAGDDVYGVRTVGLGCGLAGFGMLVDESGDDRYRVVGLGLGAGAAGIGLVMDRLGDDAYEAGRAGEGFGTDLGVGWLADSAGDDVYRGGDWVQAEGRAGGAGLLTDQLGRDLYRASSGQGSASGGFAALVDAAGDDSYVATASAQSFAEKGGVAFLIDGAGDDSYFLMAGPGQAAAFGAVAALFDREGNDVYGGTDETPATASEDGVALLLDAQGDDRYLAAGPFSPSEDGIALWADGSGRDRYGEGRSDAQAALGASSAAYDAPGASDSAGALPPLPNPGSIPMPAADVFAQIARQASEGPDRRGAISKLVGIGVPALEVLSASGQPEDVFVALAARLGRLAEPTVARLATSRETEDVRRALRTAGAVKLPAAAIIAALARPELAADAIQAAGRAQERAAVSALLPLAASNDVAMVRLTVRALAEIGDPAAASTGAALLDHPDFAVRRAAQQVLLNDLEAAKAAGLRLIAATDGFHRRIGLSLLGRVGTPDALKAVGEVLAHGDRDAKIGALQALSGHVPADLIPLVESLRRDPDPLVRAVAARTDAG